MAKSRGDRIRTCEAVLILSSDHSSEKSADECAQKQIRDAVRKAVETEKNDPAGYEAWLKRHGNTVVRLVPG